MKKFLKSALYKFIYPGCAFFALFTFLMSFQIRTLSGMTKGKIYTLLFLGFGIALCNAVFYLKKMNLYFKVTTHFIGLLAVLVLTMLFSGYLEKGRWVIMVVGYVFIYAVLCPVCLFFRYKKMRKNSIDEEYKKIYD